MDTTEEDDHIRIHHRKRGILLPFKKEILEAGQNPINVLFVANPASYYAGITMNSE